MLFVIFAAILAIGVVVYKVSIYRDYDILTMIGISTSVVGCIAVVISIIVMLCSYTGVDGYIAASNARHDSLVYQYENDIYDNDNDLGKRELIKDIQNWNEDLARYKENQDDFWIGIYIPNIYDQFEFIKLEKDHD